MTTKKKLARGAFTIGIAILLIALYLLFNTNSVWALVTLGSSILVNTFGLAVLMMK